MYRCFDHVFQNGQMAPEVKTLKHHRQFGANTLELFFVGRILTAVLEGAHADQFPMNMDVPCVRGLKKVDAAQKCAFA